VPNFLSEVLTALVALPSPWSLGSKKDKINIRTAGKVTYEISQVFIVVLLKNQFF
jgi:hypothetical protein